MMNRFRDFDWLAVVLYPLAVILMESFWVYPWLIWLGGWPVFSEQRPALSLAAVVVMLAVSLVVTRILLRQKWPMRAIRAAVVGGGLVAILLVLGVEYSAGYSFLSGGWFIHVGQVLGDTFKSPDTIVAALPVMVYLWWRGIILGQTTSYFRDIYRSFLLGMVALIVLIIIWQISSGEEDFVPPGPGIGFNVIAFFFFGLIAIAVSHLYQMRRSMPKEEAALTSVKRWLPIMLGVVGSMAVVSFLIASAFSEEFFTSIGHGIGAFFSFLGKILTYILIPFNYLFDGIFWVIRWFIELLRTEQELPPGGPGAGGLPEFEEVVPRGLPDAAILAIKWVVIILIIAAVIYILAKAISRFRGRQAQDEIEEIHESLWSWRGLSDDLKLFFSMMGSKFRRKQAPAVLEHYTDDDLSRRLNVREIYRHLLWEAARSGVARKRHETASEYSGRLRQTVPDSGKPLDSITDLYIDVRYGETAAPEEQVDNANVLWRTLRGLIRRIRG
jgi:hypothetical protein